MRFKKVVIIGMGLIGGSIGKAILKKRLAEEVVGVCRRRSSLRRAIKERSLSSGYVDNYEKALRGADIVFIATPVCGIKDIMSRVYAATKGRKVLVTDVGGTKKGIADSASRLGKKFLFIGGHPLAGSEKTGVEYSDAGLFKDSLCVLTPLRTADKKDVRDLKALWEAIGAEVKIITPGEHDRILAFTSHLPHVAAFVLAGVQEGKNSRYASTGFRDTTRIASSDPGLWRDIFLANRRNVLASISKFKGLLSEIENDIRLGRAKSLREKLEECKRMRDGFFKA